MHVCITHICHLSHTPFVIGNYFGFCFFGFSGARKLLAFRLWMCMMKSTQVVYNNGSFPRVIHHSTIGQSHMALAKKKTRKKSTVFELWLRASFCEGQSSCRWQGLNHRSKHRALFSSFYNLNWKNALSCRSLW